MIRSQVSPQRQKTSAIVAMLAASMFYLLGDTVVKLVAENIPPAQIIAIRGLMTSVLVLIAAYSVGVLRAWPSIFNTRVLLRGGLDGGATLCFTAALVHMRIADATAVINAAPVAATIIAILLLRERVSSQRWLATIGGFVGVVLVLRPDMSGLDIFSLLAVAAMAMVAVREVVTRGITREVPALLVTLCSTVTVTCVGSVATLISLEWVRPSLAELGLLGMSSFFLFGAYHLSVVALRGGEVSLVAPFRYAVILWSLLMGFFVWGDIPEPVGLAGMMLIAACGLLILRSEYRGVAATTKATGAPPRD
jgi:drug/metabolite transporter (DMT)-like permease